MKAYKLISVLVIIAALVSACGGATQTPTAGLPQPTGVTPVVQPTAVIVEPTATVETPVEAPTVAPTAAVEQPPTQLTSKEVNLYAWSEYIPQQLLDNFTQETGVKVNYDAYSSNEELLAKLQAGGSGYDVVIPSDYTVAIMIKQDMLEKLDMAQIPNFANIDDKFKNLSYDPGNQYTVPYQWGTSCLVLDKSKVTTPVTKWADLWNPEFKDKVVLLDDEREVLGMVLVVLGYDKNSTDPTQLEAAKAKFAELMPNVRLFDSDSPKTALLAGEVWLGQTWNGEAALAHQENPNIDYIFPEEGCTVWYDNLAIPKGAPHLDAAHALINWILKADQSILITKEFPYSNPNKAGLDLLKTEDPQAYDAYMSSPATNPTDADMQKLHMIVDVGDATTLWDQIWTEVKGGE